MKRATGRGILGNEDRESERQGEGDSESEIGRQGEVDSTGRWKQEEGDMERAGVEDKETGIRRGRQGSRETWRGRQGEGYRGRVRQGGGDRESSRLEELSNIS